MSGNNTGNNSDQCVCNCLHFRELEKDFFDYYVFQPEELNLNDRLPGNQCEDAKAILIMNDATLYCKYDLSMGWVIETYASGGKVFNERSNG